MAKEGVELVSVTNHFKFTAPDGKQRQADGASLHGRQRTQYPHMVGIDYSYYYEQED